MISKYLLFIALIASQVINAQEPEKTVVGKIGSGLFFSAELSYRITDNDTICSLRYRNYEYQSNQTQDIREITFSNKGNAMEQFYQLIETVFKKENRKNPDYKVVAKLNTQDVVIKPYIQYGTTSANVAQPKGYFVIDEKRLDKLFAKGK
ncbi:hypothetical protein WSM22_19350 [Cytophagales bacterium WSM2-2]|nr:hypothetical protein WSM22_19350 [Cytophagales bacterium WSM2-2]